MGTKVDRDHLSQDLSAVLIIFLRVLHEAETVHVAHVTLAIGPQQVKATHCLLWGIQHRQLKCK